MYSYCSSTYSYCCLCILIVVYVFLDAATLTEVFPCFFLGCKANARVILAKTGHGPHPSKIVVLFYVLFILYCSMYCLCVNVYCHRVITQLQLTNISYHIYKFWPDQAVYQHRRHPCTLLLLCKKWIVLEASHSCDKQFEPRQPRKIRGREAPTATWPWGPR